MKLALIPPLCHLEDTKSTDYQLMLPHLIRYEEYTKTYMDLCADPNQFVILDNGVAEGKQIEFKEILDIADRFGVNEVVLPDVMGDAIATMNAASRAIYVHGMHYPVHYMFVAQGSTFEEVMMSVRFALSFASVKTIGIPRHLITTLNDPGARWRVAFRIVGEHIHQMAGRQIHFLGMNPTCPREFETWNVLTTYQYLRDHIRGVDTSAPYNFAYHASMMGGLERVECKRPPKYFTQHEEEFLPTAVAANIQYLKECLGDV